MNEKDVALHFYDMLTGVRNDKNSKIIRCVCFAVILGGIIWAGLNYFRTNVLADTKIPLDQTLFRSAPIPANNSALQKITELAQTIHTLRTAGTSIAATMDGIHNMPFNLDPVKTEPDPLSLLPLELERVMPPEEEAPVIPVLKVKMIMTADDGQRIAVVDGGGENAVVLRRGDMLPDNSGFVSAIRPNGITIIVNKQEVRYDVPEIPMYQKIRGSK